MAESERLPDVLDQAAELTRRLGDEAIQRARRGASPEQYQGPDGSWPRTDCADCGDDIEAGRLQLGRIRCFSCQEQRERRIRLGHPA